MRVFAVYNPLVRKRRACAWVKYEPGQDSFSIELAEWAGFDELPLALALAAQRDERIITGSTARRWVESRVPPASRHNIGQVLSANGIEEYYIPTLLRATRGRSSCDDFLLEEVAEEGYRNCKLSEDLDSPSDLGVQLSRARRAAGLTQAQLAERCGVQQAVISRIEGGKGNPTLETVELLARGCGRTLRLSLE
ncbi:MAG: helix-turn-helix domain-containing protein [Coriobacteriales bacterium]